MKIVFCCIIAPLSLILAQSLYNNKPTCAQVGLLYSIWLQMGKIRHIKFLPVSPHPARLRRATFPSGGAMRPLPVAEQGSRASGRGRRGTTVLVTEDIRRVTATGEGFWTSNARSYELSVFVVSGWKPVLPFLVAYRFVNTLNCLLCYFFFFAPRKGEKDTIP